MAAKQASPAPYLLAYGGLVVLAGTSIVFARAVPWRHWDLVINLAVAATQAAIVLWVFMHLSEASFPIRLGLGLAVSLLLTLLLLTAADVATREVDPPGPRPGPSFGFYRR